MEALFFRNQAKVQLFLPQNYSVGNQKYTKNMQKFLKRLVFLLQLELEFIDFKLVFLHIPYWLIIYRCKFSTRKQRIWKIWDKI